MPGGDRTGPRGMGARTGRGMGYCSSYDAPGYANPGPGFGRGRGWWGGGRGWGGGGRGWRHRYYATGVPGWAWPGFSPAPEYAGPYWEPMTRQQETDLLKNQADVLKQELDAITKRLDELESQG